MCGPFHKKNRDNTRKRMNFFFRATGFHKHKKEATHFIEFRFYFRVCVFFLRPIFDFFMSAVELFVAYRVSSLRTNGDRRRYGASLFFFSFLFYSSPMYSCTDRRIRRPKRFSCWRARVNPNDRTRYDPWTSRPIVRVLMGDALIAVAWERRRIETPFVFFFGFIKNAEQGRLMNSRRHFSCRQTSDSGPVKGHFIQFDCVWARLGLVFSGLSSAYFGFIVILAGFCFWKAWEFDQVFS